MLIRLVNLSMKVVIQSYPFMDSWMYVTKSIETDPHRCSGISRGCSVPNGLTLPSLFTLQLSQPRQYNLTSLALFFQ